MYEFRKKNCNSIYIVIGYADRGGVKTPPFNFEKTVKLTKKLCKKIKNVILYIMYINEQEKGDKDVCKYFSKIFRRFWKQRK